jgi:hypothetical protein
MTNSLLESQGIDQKLASDTGKKSFARSGGVV